VEYLFQLGKEDAWSRYGKPWDAAQKADTKFAQAKKAIGEVAEWRSSEGDEEQIPVLQSHLAPGESRNSFNPVFGTGGNAGKRMFASGWDTARETILNPKRGVEDDDLRGDLQAFLHGGSARILGDFAAGCWFSSANKIYNSGTAKPFAEGQVTPWAMLLACEAFPFLAGSASRLLGAQRKQNAAFPFVTRAPAPENESACGQWLGDFWAPVWERPMALPEIVALFQSGRTELSGKAALTAAAFAGAIVQRGVDAGITEFRCFTLQRTTSENTFESQLSRVVRVPPHSPLFNEFFRRVIAFRDQLPRDRKQGKSWRFKGLQGPLDRTLIVLAEAVGEGGEELQAERALAVLDAMSGALAKADRKQSHRAANVAFERLPLDWLAWLAQAAGVTREVRLALALASIKPEIPEQTAKPAERARFPQAFLAYRFGTASRGGRWSSIPKDRPLRAIWSQRSLVDNIAALARRRLLDSIQTKPSAIAPFRSNFPAPVADVIAFLEGRTEDNTLARWIDRLCLFDWFDPVKENHAKLGAVLKSDEPEWLEWTADAALYAFYRPLFDDWFFRALVTQKRQWKRKPKDPLLATSARVVPVASALERGDTAAAWEQARSVLHALEIPVADFESAALFAPSDPRRLLGALCIPAQAHGLYEYFDTHWRSPSQPTTESNAA
jgi:CRISPR-associated protein Csx17